MKTLNFVRNGRITVSAIALTLASAFGFADSGAVFTMTNEAAGNKVVAYARAANGTLSLVNSYSTGGKGTGAGLGSQGAIQISPDGKWLLAVNGGTNNVSIFAIKQSGLVLVDKSISGGTTPISLTIHDKLVYVLNAGGTGSIQGFTLADNGHLRWLSNSHRSLSGNAVAGAEVAFSPEGDLLLVSEKASNKLSAYTVDANTGLVTSQVAQNSSGAVPFGFVFGKRGRVYVSEAPGSAVSSYSTWDDGTLVPITPSLGDTQAAACWVATTPNGKFVYAANAASGTVSGYEVHPDGSLSLLNANGQTGIVGAGSAVIDLAVSQNGKYLYVVARNFGGVYEFAIGANGGLTPIGNTSGLPTSSTTGIAAW